MDPIVDVHCHTFNADDLPVRGFISHVALHEATLGRILAPLVDSLVQSGAPGYAAERSKLDAMLGSSELRARGVPVLLGEQIGAGVEPEGQLELETDQAFAELQLRSEPLLRQVDEAMRAAYPTPAPEGMEELALPSYADAKRAIRWILLFGKYRFELTQLLVANFGDRVDLFCPLAVDLDSALGDDARTTPRQQMELQEKIGRLSMLGKLPKGGKARVHQFVAFDPVREARARLLGDIEKPLDLVRVAIEDYGFVGVKVYPPMGWRPIGNADLPADVMPEPLGQQLDEALTGFYGWCRDMQVPITAHCNRSNFTGEKVADLAGPQGWLDVLERFPELHLDLGHFGGVHPPTDDKPGFDWPGQIARGAKDFEHLFVDVSNHATYDREAMRAYQQFLDGLFQDPATAAIQDRIMFGSDWYMEALHPKADEFLSAYEDFFGHWGDEAKRGFLGRRALRFLGFDDPTNKNNQRLRARYDAFAKDRMPDWLSQP